MQSTAPYRTVSDDFSICDGVDGCQDILAKGLFSNSGAGFGACFGGGVELGLGYVHC